MLDWIQIVLAAPPAEAKPSPDYTGFIFFFLMIGVAFYLIIIRPQRREQQQKQQMLSEIEKGDRVVTIGGIHGEVVGVDQADNTVTVEVSKNVKIKFSRSAVSTVLERKGRKSAEEPKA